MNSLYQKTISSSQLTLPIVAVVSLALWLLLPGKGVSADSGVYYGLWTLLPAFLGEGLAGKILGLVSVAVMVYMMAELINSNVLLRVSSRMLSSTLMFFMLLALDLHVFQPAHIVMLLSMLSYFSLFASYHFDTPSLSYASHFFVSLSSLFCPELLLMTIFVWVVQFFLSSLSFRGVVASVMAILTPYWLFFSVSLYMGELDFFLNFMQEVLRFRVLDYSNLRFGQIVLFGYVGLLFLAGYVDFIITKLQDKIRSRALYNIVIAHGLVVGLMAWMLPEFFNIFLGLFIIDSSIVSGRFWVVTDNKFTHYFFFVLMLVALLLLALTMNM